MNEEKSNAGRFLLRSLQLPFFFLGLSLEGLQLRCVRSWGRALLVAGAGDGGSSRARLAPPAAPSVYDGCTATAAAATGGGAEMAVALFFYGALRPPPS